MTSGTAQSAATRGGQALPTWLVYVMVASGTAATCAVNALSVSHDLTRLGRDMPFWQPLLWELSSGALIVALAPLIRWAVSLSMRMPGRFGVIVPLHFGTAVLFSALHVLGMVALRKLGYAMAGRGPYLFDLSSSNLLYELRKDVLVYLLIAGVFWLAARLSDKSAAAGPAQVVPDTNPVAVGDVWLKDGAISIRLEPQEITWVASAGNYVEYSLASGRRHLIRATLLTEEERLAPFGIVRVHRTRLVNTSRIRRATARPSGDFELEMDTGETIAGSRRYRAAIAGLAA